MTVWPSEGVDNFTTFMNITATDGALIAQYQSYMEQGNTAQANEILAQIPQGTQKIIKATDVNKWTQAILALERFYISDIEPYIQQQQEDWQAIVDQFSYQGEWASGTTYVTNNFVSYTSGGVTMLYIATGNPPTGTAPTNTTYWRPLTIRGQQGQSGTGLAYRESWDAGTQYSANDAVSYEGALWMALQANQNITPGTNASYWQKVIGFEATTYPIQDTEPTNLEAGSLWFNTSGNPTMYYYLEALANPAVASQILYGYQVYDDEGNVMVGTLPAPTTLTITAPPSKTQYFVGDTFEPDGMVITVGYSDGSSKVVTNYTYSPTGALTVDDTSVTVSYTDLGVTVSATQAISVSAGTPISSLAVGSIVKVNENGSPVNYMIVQQGNPDISAYDASCDGTWLLRQDCAENRQWNSTNNNAYANSTIHSYLNNTWINEYDSGTQGIIKQVKIPYVNGAGDSPIASGVNGLSCKIFLLSGYEVGFRQNDNEHFPQDSVKLSYFEAGTGSSANNKRIANLSGGAVLWWLRSPRADSTIAVWHVSNSGNSGSDSCTRLCGIRPCFIIPSTTPVDSDNNIIIS